jgi:hypothetical protein
MTDIKNVKPGEIVNCWYPDFHKRPWKTEVLSVEPRVGGSGGVLLTIKNRKPCQRCISFRHHELSITLGQEWFDAQYARAARAKRRELEAQEKARSEARAR